MRLYQARHWSTSSGRRCPVSSRSASKTQLRVMESKRGSAANRTSSGIRTLDCWLSMAPTETNAPSESELASRVLRLAMFCSQITKVILHFSADFEWFAGACDLPQPQHIQ